MMKRAVARYGRGLWDGLREGFRLDAVPLATASTFIFLALALLAANGINGFNVLSMISYCQLILISVGLCILLNWGWRLIKTRPSSPIRFSLDYANEVFGSRRVGRFIPVIIAVSVFIPVFSAMKGSMSRLVTYSWDGFFIDADRLIHGQDVWRILQPVFGFPIITSGLSFAYHLWLVLVVASTIFFIFRAGDVQLRRQWLTSYFLCWALIGTVMAMLFASVGPCFLDPILHRNDFTPLMDYLRDADRQWPVWVIQVQERLLDQYQGKSTALGAGITAMPSMHVSMALLFWLGLRGLSRWLSALFLIFLILILIGSVHLGYHYAVDGYVAIIATLAIWKFAGWLVARFEPQSPEEASIS